MPSISYAITACNEHAELERLLDQLYPALGDIDEIVIQLDTIATEEVKEVAFKYPNITITAFPLMGDFAQFKNNLKKYCTKDYIFQIDADEYLSEHLLKLLSQILLANPDVDCFALPRVNTVRDLTQEHIQKWGWVVDDKNRVNWPDYQTRICKNIPEIQWVGKVHERLQGWKTSSHFPFEFEDWALIHPKTIERQEKQNNYYNTL